MRTIRRVPVSAPHGACVRALPSILSEIIQERQAVVTYCIIYSAIPMPNGCCLRLFVQEHVRFGTDRGRRGSTGVQGDQPAR